MNACNCPVLSNQLHDPRVAVLAGSKSRPFYGSVPSHKRLQPINGEARCIRAERADARDLQSIRGSPGGQGIYAHRLNGARTLRKGIAH